VLLLGVAVLCVSAVLQVCHAASDEVLVTGGYDTAVKVWDCRSWNQDPIQTMTHCKVGQSFTVSRTHVHTSQMEREFSFWGVAHACAAFKWQSHSSL
jgi:hypothetical protein